MVLFLSGRKSLLSSARPALTLIKTFRKTGRLSPKRNSRGSAPLHSLLIRPSRWIYEKMWTLDACFKLSLKAGGKKNSDDEPVLAPGGGVFVDQVPYQELLKKNKKAAEVRCAIHPLTECSCHGPGRDRAARQGRAHWWRSQRRRLGPLSQAEDQRKGSARCGTR